MQSILRNILINKENLNIYLRIIELMILKWGTMKRGHTKLVNKIKHANKD